MDESGPKISSKRTGLLDSAQSTIYIDNLGIQSALYQFRHGFNLIDEAIYFPIKFVQEWQQYDSQLGLKSEDRLSADLFSAYQNITSSTIFRNSLLCWHIDCVLGMEYCRFLNGKITEETFLSNMSKFLFIYSKDKDFEFFWKECYLSTILDYDKKTQSINLNLDTIARDQENIRDVEESMIAGSIDNKTPGFLDLVHKMIRNGINIKVGREFEDEFFLKDIKFSKIEYLSQLNIQEVVDLVDIFNRMKKYAILLFSLNALASIRKITTIPDKSLNEIGESKIITKEFLHRINIYREFYINCQNGLQYSPYGPFETVVKTYFNKKYAAVIDAETMELLVQEIDDFYYYFPDFKAVGFLDHFLENKNIQTEQLAISKIRINGKEVYVTSNLIDEVVRLAQEELSLDEKSEILARLKRKGIWNTYINPIINYLLTSPDFNSLAKFVKENSKRIIALSELGEEEMSRIDKSMIALLIDDGRSTDNILCAVIFVLEIADEENRVELLIRTPDQVKVTASNSKEIIIESINTSIDTDSTNIIDIPIAILNFCRQNKLPDFDFDFETEPLKKFVENVAMYIAIILSNGRTYLNQSVKGKIERFLQLCSSDSEIKEAIIIHLANLISGNQIDFMYGKSNNPASSLKTMPKAVARSILNYLTLNYKTSADKYDAGFTIEAIEKFEHIADSSGYVYEPDKSTAFKAKVGSKYRIHFCYVNEKLEMCITKAHR
ncbi:MAG: hypothetical protein ABI721_05580 [Candidatus Dojkabacteria bacterium]